MHAIPAEKQRGVDGTHDQTSSEAPPDAVTGHPEINSNIMFKNHPFEQIPNLTELIEMLVKI